MFKKEFRDALKILVHCLGIFLVYPALRVLDWDLGYPQWDFKGAWDFLYTIFAAVFAGYSGVALLAAEKADGAMEYLFALPVSRGYIVANKIGSRFLLLLPVYLLGIVSGALTNPASDGLGLLLIFCFAVSVGLAVDSVFLGVLGVLILQFIIYFAALMVQYLQAGAGIPFQPAGLGAFLLLPGLVLAVPALLAFWVSFKRMDLKPRDYHVKPYLWIALPSVLLVLAFVIFNYRGFTKWIKLY
jgi:ABC-type transport system involved in multi-copper enzyme maturation permease subunit